MPAPAVIPALIAYVKVVAVKTLVVGFRSSEPCVGIRVCCPSQGGALGSDKGGRRSNVLSAASSESQGGNLVASAVGTPFGWGCHSL